MVTRGESALTYQARREAEVRGYSRTVRWMKVVLPVAAVLLIGLIFMTGKDRGGAIDAGSAADLTALSAGLKLENPRFAGVTDEGDPFVVTADWALPDGAVPDRVDLENPAGEIRLRDGRTLTVTSATGEMFRKDERLHLKGGVVMQTSDGYRVQTEQVALDLDQRTAHAPTAVKASGPRGGIQADRVTIETGPEESGDAVMRFEGNVRVLFRPAARDQ